MNDVFKMELIKELIALIKACREDIADVKKHVMELKKKESAK